MFGDGYIAQHIQQEYTKSQESEVFKIYIADALKVVVENTANFAGGKTMTSRYYDLIKEEKEPEQTAEEIKSNIKRKLRKIGGGKR